VSVSEPKASGLTISNKALKPMWHSCTNPTELDSEMVTGTFISVTAVTNGTEIMAIWVDRDPNILVEIEIEAYHRKIAFTPSIHPIAVRSYGNAFQIGPSAGARYEVFYRWRFGKTNYPPMWDFSASEIQAPQ
jgi:hypothetical protein